MTYSINIASAYDRVDEEVSRIAATSYNEAGQSLYDGIVLHSNDHDDIVRMINGSINVLVARTWDMVTITPGDTPTLTFNAPDLDPGLGASIKAELDNFIAFDTAAAWFRLRATDHVELFSTRAQEALAKAVAMLHTRKDPLA